MASKRSSGAKSGAKSTAAEASAEPGAAVLRKKDFLERVTLATGGKKNQVREVAEAVLEVLGAALARGEALNLPPFGKAKLARRKQAAGGEVLTVKLRRAAEGGKSGADSGGAPLAEAED